MTEPGKLAPARSHRARFAYAHTDSAVVAAAMQKRKRRRSNNNTNSGNATTTTTTTTITDIRTLGSLTWLEASSDPRLSDSARTLALNFINDRVAFYYVWYDLVSAYVDAWGVPRAQPVEYTWKHRAEQLYAQLQRRALNKYAPRMSLALLK